MIVHKLKRLESSLAQSSTSIICPSQTIADNILKRWGQHREGPQAIPSPLWIPNGAHLPENLSVAEHTTPSENSPFQMIYFGTCKPWQGVDLLLKACSRLLDLPNWKLTLCISNRTKHIKPLLRQARKTGLVERLEWKFKLNRPVLQEELRQSHLSLAPLSLHPRNLLQGCAPLKILESLAMAVPVLSTRLPCVEEWVEHGQQAHLVHPNDVDELERALRQLYASPEKRQDMSLKAREHLKNNFQWTHSTEKLRQLYANIHEQRKSLNKPHHSSPILFSEA
jgi:glycosyltransferase involved in cell wall biosynthesis